jgi:xanthine dehydrogenase accessory factor
VFDRLVVIRGGGDLGSGVALRLWRAGFRVVIVESASPIAVRRTVSFSEAVYEGAARVEEVNGELVGGEQAFVVAGSGRVAVVVDPEAEHVARLRPYALVDAIMAKRNVGTHMGMAPCVIGLGPGFSAGVDVTAVVETNRGPNLGRVYWRGGAEADTGRPGSVHGHGVERVLRAPTAGQLRTRRAIGDVVQEGDVIADVDDLPVPAAFTGMVRGLARDGLEVRRGMKIGDLDPRLDPTLCLLVSDKALAVAGGVLEAILMCIRDEKE